MKRLSAFGFTISIILYTLLYFISYLYSSPVILQLISICGFVAVISSLFYLPMRQLGVPLFLLSAALLIQVLTTGAIMNNTLEGLQVMSGLIALLLIVPMISWVLEEEPYMAEIMSFARNRLNTSKNFYFGMITMTQIISYFLIFAAIPMVYHLVTDFLGSKADEELENFKSTALLRGFALTTMWVISIPSFVFAVEHLGASLVGSILQGFFISCIGVILAIVFFHFREKSNHINITAGIQEEVERIIQTSKDCNSNRLVLEFSLLFLSLFGTIFFLHILFGWPLLIIIPIVIFLWTWFYFVLKKQWPKFINKNKNYVGSGMANKAQQFTILLSAGIFIHSINQSGLGNKLVDGILLVTNVIPWLNILWILPIVVIILGFFGLGPLTVIVLVAGILENVSLPYPPELIVLSITSGSVISILLSPFILPVIVLSAANGLSIFKNGVKYNIGYTVVFYFIVQVYLQVMGHFMHG